MRHFKLLHLSSGKRSQPQSVNGPVPASYPAVVGPEPTPRELEVEELLCRGYSQENIAAIFGRSIHTISVHTLSLYRKRGVHTQVGLLLAYLERRGIVVFPDQADDSVARQGEPVGAMP
jgi:DNA-binding CsgD family transcriptional regulator